MYIPGVGEASVKYAAGQGGWIVYSGGQYIPTTPAIASYLQQMEYTGAKQPATTPIPGAGGSSPGVYEVSRTKIGIDSTTGKELWGVTLAYDPSKVAGWGTARPSGEQRIPGVTVTEVATGKLIEKTPDIVQKTYGGQVVSGTIEVPGGYTLVKKPIGEAEQPLPGYGLGTGRPFVTEKTIEQTGWKGLDVVPGPYAKLDRSNIQYQYFLQPQESYFGGEKFDALAMLGLGGGKGKAPSAQVFDFGSYAALPSIAGKTTRTDIGIKGLPWITAPVMKALTLEEYELGRKPAYYGFDIKKINVENMFVGPPTKRTITGIFGPTPEEIISGTKIFLGKGEVPRNVVMSTYTPDTFAVKPYAFTEYKTKEEEYTATMFNRPIVVFTKQLALSYISGPVIGEAFGPLEEIVGGKAVSVLKGVGFGLTAFQIGTSAVSGAGKIVSGQRLTEQEIAGGAGTILGFAGSIQAWGALQEGEKVFRIEKEYGKVPYSYGIKDYVTMEKTTKGVPESISDILGKVRERGIKYGLLGEEEFKITEKVTETTPGGYAKEVGGNILRMSLYGKEVGAGVITKEEGLKLSLEIPEKVSMVKLPSEDVLASLGLEQAKITVPEYRYGTIGEGGEVARIIHMPSFEIVTPKGYILSPISDVLAMRAVSFADYLGIKGGVVYNIKESSLGKAIWKETSGFPEHPYALEWKFEMQPSAMRVETKVLPDIYPGLPDITAGKWVTYVEWGEPVAKAFSLPKIGPYAKEIGIGWLKPPEEVYTVTRFTTDIPIIALEEHWTPTVISPGAGAKTPLEKTFQEEFIKYALAPITQVEYTPSSLLAGWRTMPIIAYIPSSSLYKPTPTKGESLTKITPSGEIISKWGETAKFTKEYPMLVPSKDYGISKELIPYTMPQPSEVSVQYPLSKTILLPKVVVGIKEWGWQPEKMREESWVKEILKPTQIISPVEKTIEDTFTKEVLKPMEILQPKQTLELRQMLGEKEITTLTTIQQTIPTQPVGGGGGGYYELPKGGGMDILKRKMPKTKLGFKPLGRSEGLPYARMDIYRAQASFMKGIKEVELPQTKGMLKKWKVAGGVSFAKGFGTLKVREIPIIARRKRKKKGGLFV